LNFELILLTGWIRRLFAVIDVTTTGVTGVVFPVELAPLPEADDGVFPPPPALDADPDAPVLLAVLGVRE